MSVEEINILNYFKCYVKEFLFEKLGCFLWFCIGFDFLVIEKIIVSFVNVIGFVKCLVVYICSFLLEFLKVYDSFF